MTSFLIASNVLLWLALIGVAIVMFGLLRQIGLLHERSAPMGAMMTDEGPDVGDAAPVLARPGDNGPSRRGGGAPPPGPATRRLFTAPTCPVCDKLFPIIKSTARAEKISVILVSDGQPDEHERFLRSHDLAGIPYVVSAEVGMRFQVGKIPYGVLLDASGVIRAKGLTNTREHLESLLEADKSGFSSIQKYLASRKAA